MKTPGITFLPRIITKARANPDGGQTGEAFVFSYARSNPRRALIKYKALTPSNSKIVFNKFDELDVFIIVNNFAVVI